LILDENPIIWGDRDAIYRGVPDSEMLAVVATRTWTIQLIDIVPAPSVDLFGARIPGCRRYQRRYRYRIQIIAIEQVRRIFLTRDLPYILVPELVVILYELLHHAMQSGSSTR
jgi:hypothetical protein